MSEPGATVVPCLSEGSAPTRGNQPAPPPSVFGGMHDGVRRHLLTNVNAVAPQPRYEILSEAEAGRCHWNP